MELFMHNLPPHITDNELKRHLTPLVNSLGIRDWSCQKQRKKKFGNITFLYANDGTRFQKQTPVVILNTPAYCKPSKYDPDPFLLKSLAKSAEDRQEAEQYQYPHKAANVVVAVQSFSCGYYSYVDNKLVYSPELEWETERGIAKFVKNTLIVTFGGPGRPKRIEIPYRIVEGIIVSTQLRALTLTLWETPRLFEEADQDLAMLMASLGFQQRSHVPSRTRLSELPHSTQSHRAISGQSLVYRMVLSAAEFGKTTKQLLELDCFAISHYNFPAVPLHAQRSLVEGLKSFNMAVQEFADVLPFSVLYQLEALVRNGFLLPWTVETLLIRMATITKGKQKLNKEENARVSSVPNTKQLPYDMKRCPISAGAVKKLFSQLPFPSLEVDASTFGVSEIWGYLEDNEKEIRKGLGMKLISERARQNLTEVFKVNITPTGMTLQGPEPEAKNRILRRFPDHTEYFIRVQFCEEDGTDVQFNSRVSNDRIYQRFKDVFKNGIAIGGRVYGFLGFSHSSLRSHAAWFMAPFVHESKLQTYFSIISHLGHFSDIYSTARCAARIGQAFSETPVAVSLSANSIQNDLLPDVKSKDGSRVFSDGVGTISQQAMEAIHAVMARRKALPTCFQIRWGGAKGMLALDARLEGKVMMVRPSMVKFESNDKANLEICDMANKPIPLVLNRQTIKILEDLGVPKEWFFQQQNRALRRLQLITAHIANTVGFLQRQKIADSIGFPQLLRRLSEIGIDYRNDRFLCSVVETTILCELRLLKHKARIPIEKGVTLFGIMDETGYLEEGEVYVTFDDADFISGHMSDLDGLEVIVTRSPALHPGDIQLATNIIPPDFHPLRMLKNCIVFSQKGKRDLPSCLSGGDLDGDLYGIIWDQRAVKQCNSLYEPADYPRVEPLNLGRTVTREDMTDFFVQFMATDQLGLIAVKHMILADQKDAGTADQDCLLLAQMHSTGVDYSKSGIPVDMSLFRQLKSNKYRPDFLAPAPPANIQDRTEILFDVPTAPSANDNDEDENPGPTHLYYRSDRILGLLYRAIDEKKIWFENIKFPVHHGVGVFDGLFSYIKSECASKLGGISWTSAITEKAWEIRHAYEGAIATTTLDYSEHAAISITELEVFTGSIYNRSGVHTRRQRDKSLRLRDEFERIAKWAQGVMRKRDIATEEEGQNDEADTPDEALALSLACLHVGCINDTGKSSSDLVRRGGSPFYSFKVVAACCAVKELDAAIRRAETVSVETEFASLT
ncbi:RdRP-domain-containing protein [Cucurbitaria berberidis CBS 394.84]|uniref:RNA-dependent RNA polymerase n=1 Tax=Cucurbitaria berberidis CBS 394.84 TaxID=1168544 RepID=A0A9P4GC28_9PLEO|nr:RdRP-domain-containing protein [Cucurbitaria berberidis CBS 394.84]KAF1842606.1 RdRP-domain-containing protein [Cucurbitaria berberidis CBS 394.84]